MKPKIVVLDAGTLGLPEEHWDSLRGFGFDLILFDSTPKEDAVIGERVAGATVVLTNKVPLRRPVLEQCAALRFVSVLATGYNIIDLTAAADRGVVVSNVPAYSTESVAQHTIALLLALTNRVELHADSVARGEWSGSCDFSYWLQNISDLAGKTLGIVGFGTIGRRVGEIGHAFGMHILGSARRHRNPPSYERFAWAEIDDIFSRADVVSLHCPLTPETENLVNRERLAMMRPEALLLNTSRGALVDERALATALEQGQLRGCGLDVLAEEPMNPNCPLRNAPRCLITPHMAWASEESRKRLLKESARNLKAFVDGHPRHVVSPEPERR